MSLFDKERIGVRSTFVFFGRPQRGRPDRIVTRWDR